MARFFKRVLYRSAAPIVTSVTKGGSYPNYTVSGWTPLPGSVEVATMQPAADKETPADGGSTNAVHGEQLPTEITITDFSKSDYNTLRALNNTKQDIMFLDPDQEDTAFVAHGVRLYVKLDVQTAGVPKIMISGLRKYATSLATSPFQMIDVT